MGYWYGWKSKPELIAELSKGAIEKKLVGSHLWVLVENEVEGSTLIGLYLLSKSGGKWGYKPLSESEHPYYYSCPLSFLAKAPELCPAWRKKVKEWHLEKEVTKALKKLATI